MRYYVTDKFDMPHEQNVAATVIRVDHVNFDRTLFGKITAKIWLDNETSDEIEITRSMENPPKGYEFLKGNPPYPTIDDKLLLHIGDIPSLNWYIVGYELLKG